MDKEIRRLFLDGFRPFHKTFLVEHENVILTAYGQNNAKPGKAWKCLERKLPGLSRAMTFNTFKQYVSVFAFVKTELDKVRQNEVTQKTSRLENDKIRLQRKLHHAVNRLDKVRQNRDNILSKSWMKL